MIDKNNVSKKTLQTLDLCFYCVNLTYPCSTGCIRRYCNRTSINKMNNFTEQVQLWTAWECLKTEFRKYSTNILETENDITIIEKYLELLFHVSFEGFDQVLKILNDKKIEPHTDKSEERLIKFSKFIDALKIKSEERTIKKPNIVNKKKLTCIEAFEYLKNGHKIKRKDWKNEGLKLDPRYPNSALLYNLHYEEYVDQDEYELNINDILANDWEIIEYSS